MYLSSLLRDRSVVLKEGKLANINNISKLIGVEAETKDEIASSLDSNSRTL